MIRFAIFTSLMLFYVSAFLFFDWVRFGFDYITRIETVLIRHLGHNLASSLVLPISVAISALGVAIGLVFEAISSQKILKPLVGVCIGIGTVLLMHSAANIALHWKVAGPYLFPSAEFVLSIICGPFLLTSFYLTLRTLLPYPLPTSMQKPMRGTSVIRNHALALAVFRKLSSRCKPLGPKIHPQVRLPASQETRHFLYIGSHGSGKGQAIYQLLSDIRERPDPVLVYDFKGDYTSAFGEDKGSLIVSPFDQRGVAWDVASDIDTVLKANEFSNMLLPDEASREPFFRKAAQDLLTGVIQRLQHEKPQAWTFSDLVELLNDADNVIQSCKDYRPAALNNLGDPKEKQAAGVLGELRTGTMQLEFLAQAWQQSTNRFSISRWIESNFTHNQVATVILRGNPEFTALDGFLASCFFTILAKKTLSLSDSYERRLWVFLDEFGNLPKVQSIDSLLTAVRSKGVRVVVGLQDIGQVETKYGNSFRQTFFNCFGTVLAGLCASETAKYLSEAFGKHQILHTVKNKSISRGGAKSGSSTSRSESQTVSIENSLLDSEFSGLQPPDLKNPARFWFKFPGWPIGPLVFTVKPLPNLYAPFKVASWLTNHPGLNLKQISTSPDTQKVPLGARSEANASALTKLGSFTKKEESTTPKC